MQLATEWANARGFTLNQIAGEITEWIVPTVCPKMEIRGNLKMCSVHGGSKPEVCKNSPFLGREIPGVALDPEKSMGPTCGFRDQKK